MVKSFISLLIQVNGFISVIHVEDFTTHKDEARKQRYIARHKKNEDFTDINSAGFWSRFYLWEKPTKKEAYENIKKKYIN